VSQNSQRPKGLAGSSARSRLRCRKVASYVGSEAWRMHPNNRYFASEMQNKLQKEGDVYFCFTHRCGDDTNRITTSSGWGKCKQTSVSLIRTVILITLARRPSPGNS